MHAFILFSKKFKPEFPVAKAWYFPSAAAIAKWNRRKFLSSGLQFFLVGPARNHVHTCIQS
jgi:hypothetical protein